MFRSPRVRGPIYFPAALGDVSFREAVWSKSAELQFGLHGRDAEGAQQGILNRMELELEGN